RLARDDAPQDPPPFPTRLSSDLDQLMPSITAVIAAPRTAIVAASTVTAAAKQRSRRSPRPRATAACGRAAGIAGRISSGIVDTPDRKSTRLNSSHEWISYAVFCL